MYTMFLEGTLEKWKQVVAVVEAKRRQLLLSC
jgi:hypothetical protein